RAEGIPRADMPGSVSKAAGTDGTRCRHRRNPVRQRLQRNDRRGDSRGIGRHRPSVGADRRRRRQGTGFSAASVERRKPLPGGDAAGTRRTDDRGRTVGGDPGDRVCAGARSRSGPGDRACAARRCGPVVPGMREPRYVPRLPRARRSVQGCRGGARDGGCACLETPASCQPCRGSLRLPRFRARAAPCSTTTSPSLGLACWLSLYVVNLQPSELMKLFVVLYAASYAVRKASFLHAEQPLRQTLLKGFLPLLAVMIATGALLLHEPDFGACVVIVAIAFGILFLGGLDWRLLIGLGFLLPVALWLMIRLAPYRLQRFGGFLDPWSDPLGKGYQLTHSLIAFGRGEWLGVGLGASVEKLLYLPEAHTDFLLAVVAEELGFAGVTLVIVLFAWLLVRAYAIGRQAARLERPFSALVAHGIGIWIGVQTFINIGVNMGVLPTKGLTLPLLSFGGSGILANCLALAILMRVDF